MSRGRTVVGLQPRNLTATLTSSGMTCISLYDPGYMLQYQPHTGVFYYGNTIFVAGLINVNSTANNVISIVQNHVYNVQQLPCYPCPRIGKVNKRDRYPREPTLSLDLCQIVQFQRQNCPSCSSSQSRQSIIVIVCQMLSRWTKNSPHSINISDIIIYVLPLCSVYQVPSYESNLTLLASFPTELAYWSMLFILEMVCYLIVLFILQLTCSFGRGRFVEVYLWIVNLWHPSL